MPVTSQDFVWIRIAVDKSGQQLNSDEDKEYQEILLMNLKNLPYWMQHESARALESNRKIFHLINIKWLCDIIKGSILR